MPQPWVPKFGVFSAWIDDDTRCMISVDEAADPSLRGDHSRFVSVLHELADPDERGFPSARELPALAELDAAITGRLEAWGEPWFVGRRIERGNRYLFFYLPQGPADIELEGPWPHDYEIKWFDADDPGWDEYRESLAPTPLQSQLIASGRQLVELAKLNDQHQVERPVDHFVYFPSLGQAEAAQRALEDGGFATTVSHDPPMVTAVRTHAVSLDCLEAVLEQIFVLIAPHAGDYDGWGAPVEAPETASPARTPRFWKRKS